MANTSLNISLPAPLKKYVEAATKAGDYSTPSEYVRELIREDRERSEELEKTLLAAMQGPFIRVTHEDLQSGKLIARLEAKLKKHAKGNGARSVGR